MKRKVRSMRLRPSTIAALRLAVGYAAVSVVWILVSDWRASQLAFGDALVDRGLQSAKGLAFIAATAVGIYVIAVRYLRQLEASTQQLRSAYDQTLAGWASALDLRDRSTAEHTSRVTERTVTLAKRFGIEGHELEHVRRGATLHDIGKMGIADEILRKDGPLTDDEWNEMRKHPDLAVQMLSGIEYLGPALPIPWCHHERWDGTGYPRGLAGQEIPIEARLFSVVDVYDAITSVRPYRQPMTRAEADATIRKGSGSHFDPAVVELFLAVLDSEASNAATQALTSDVSVEAERGPATPQ